MATTANLSNLVDYINELSGKIYTESVLEGRFLSGLTQQPGIKNAEKVNYVTSNIVLTDPTCGTLPTGTGSFTPFQNTLTVCPVQIQELLCVDDFEKKYYGMGAKAGSNNEMIPAVVAEAYMEQKMKDVKAKLEDEMVKGAVSGTFSSTNTKCNGILNQLTTTYTSQVVNVTATSSYNASTAIAFVNSIAAAQPVETYSEENMKLYMSYPDYRIYVNALINSNNYHIDVVESTGALKMSCIIPGTNIVVEATRGLNGITGTYTKYFILTPQWNLVYGFDSLADANEPILFYDRLTRQVIFRMNWKMGIAPVYAKYIVLAKSN